jgi:hypothetical protein
LLTLQLKLAIQISMLNNNLDTMVAIFNANITILVYTHHLYCVFVPFLRDSFVCQAANKPKKQNFTPIKRSNQHPHLSSNFVRTHTQSIYLSIYLSIVYIYLSIYLSISIYIVVEKGRNKELRDVVVAFIRRWKLDNL